MTNKRKCRPWSYIVFNNETTASSVVPWGYPLSGEQSRSRGRTWQIAFVKNFWKWHSICIYFSWQIWANKYNWATVYYCSVYNFCSRQSLWLLALLAASCENDLCGWRKTQSSLVAVFSVAFLVDICLWVAGLNIGSRRPLPFCILFIRVSLKNFFYTGILSCCHHQEAKAILLTEPTSLKAIL